MYFDAFTSVQSAMDVLKSALLISTVVTLVVITVATIFVMIFVSHKIGGPLFKFENVARQIGDGNLNVYTRLRKGDELVALSDAMTDMVGGLKEIVSNIEQSTAALEQTVEEIVQVAAQHPEIKRAAEDLAKQTKAVRDAVNTFQC